MASIPQNRMVAYILVLALLPLALVCFNYFSESAQLKLLERKALTIENSLSLDEGRYSQNSLLRLRFQNSDPYFIDSNLEKLSFLDDEVNNLTAITQDPSFPDTPSIKKRLEFLKGPENRLAFTEDTIRPTPSCKETLEVMRHPVEINLDDLYKVLSIVENVNISSYVPQANSPQLIITDFNLERKKYPSKNEVFVLNMKLLKREYQ
jgi:hypothetical protein